MSSQRCKSAGAGFPAQSCASAFNGWNCEMVNSETIAAWVRMAWFMNRKARPLSLFGKKTALWVDMVLNISAIKALLVEFRLCLNCVASHHY
jgi:hypothetical protein